MTSRSNSERQQSWGAETLWEQLEPQLPDLSVEVVARVDSTNTQLVQRLRGANSPAAGGSGNRSSGRRSTDTQPCLLVAEHQTSGRGRLGRSWQATPGSSLTFSLSLPLTPPDWSGLSLAVGLAVAEAIEPAMAAPRAAPLIGLKWPNDLWYEDRKLGGVLIEVMNVGAQRMAVIGIGLNVLPMELTGLTAGFACIHEFDPDATPASVLHQVAPRLVDGLRQFEAGGFASCARRYAARDVLVGRGVRSGSIDGTARGVSDTGALRVETAAGEQLITSDDVTIRLDSWGPTTQSGAP